MPAPDVVVVGYLGHFDVVLARFPVRAAGTLRRRKIPIVLDHLVGASDTGRDRRLMGGAPGTLAHDRRRGAWSPT